LAIALQHPSAIQSLLGNAETEHGICDASRALTRKRQNLAAAHNRSSQNYILFEQFQIELPPDGNGIILRANWRLPGGRQPLPNSELPP
jgi:hypothetical protein